MPPEFILFRKELAKSNIYETSFLRGCIADLIKDKAVRNLLNICLNAGVLQDFFQENNVAFTEHDVASDLEKRQEMIDLTSQMGVPVIRIGDDVVIGFDKGKLTELLGL